jgi:hypothetical protein
MLRNAITLGESNFTTSAAGYHPGRYREMVRCLVFPIREWGLELMRERDF